MNALKKFLSMFILFFFVGLHNTYATNSSSDCVAYTKVDNICITIPEFKSYYKHYKAEIIKEKGKGNWFFTLADKIAATKELMVQKLLLHEAEKNKIETTEYFKKYQEEIKEGIKEIDNYISKLKNEKKLSNKKLEELAKKLKARLINGYKVKAYLEMTLKDAIKVTRDDIDNFMMAHKGKYGFEPDPKNPKLQVIRKKELVEAIREEKRQLAANQLAHYLLDTYKVTINKDLLKKIKD
ncbi:hypothetical protein Dester_0717 [Desulfurobacterium thermolithotrophum DSM 11699]|uniref:Uncharacterized protein n=1 Tax=Desulfurobacterium thermolithotrophum (strain DSM 11699 / BSA) TaxID=868864 RepID=F0S3E1_DESTD|nr:hypothetical protein [Desulfurobacterium thermolithotrophum]ADY73363.1 hypothetical protein Dester_0717 [Desulfurobacterium thermolithotrophum DSM 11699]